MDNQNQKSAFFKSIAAKETTLSELMAGRTQMKTDDVIKKYPDGFTVIGFDIAELPDEAGVIKKFPVVIISEDDSIYFNGGTILNKICAEWAASYSDNIEAASEDLKQCGGVRMKLTAAKTKKGNNITRVDIL